MGIRFDRIERAQALMREKGWLGIMVMNHDVYRYFFGRDWAQPRAIIPAEGPPILAIPGVGGVRNENVYRVTPEGCEILVAYETDWIVPC